MVRPSVRTEASVVVTEPVDGSTLALATARELCGPHQRIVLVSATIVDVVNA